MLPRVAQEDSDRAEGNQRTPHPGLSPRSSPAQPSPGLEHPGLDTPSPQDTQTSWGCLTGKRQVPPLSAPSWGLLGRGRGS